MWNQALAMMSQKPPSSSRAILAARLLHVSGVTLLCVLAIIVVGALIDIANNGSSGYPNFWRGVRRPFAGLILFLLLIHGAILGIMRQLGARAFSISFGLVLIWLIVEPLWPRL